ncbi:MAG: phosphate binding protein [Holophagaceae bacterium]|nr:phosphate binding protein [Holophagaceae bacterium]
MGIQMMRTGCKAVITVICLGMANLLPAQAPPPPKPLIAGGGECLMYAMGLWGDIYKTKVPGFSLDVRVQGEDKAFGDLTAGNIQMALLARDASPEEVSAFAAKWGYPPTRVAVAMDALVWVVNKDNPIKKLTLPQIEAIFCADRSMGWPRDILTWGDAGVKAAGWADRPINRYSRTMDSSVMGLIMLFMPPTPPKQPTPFMPDAMAMTEALAADPYGICTANLVEVFASLRAVPVAPPGSEVGVEPTPDTVSSGAYPYSRFLYVYVNKDAKKGMEPTLKGFLAFALSPEGQQLVKAAGQAPLARDIWGLNYLKVTDRFDIDSSTLR